MGGGDVTNSRVYNCLVDGGSAMELARYWMLISYAQMKFKHEAT